MTSGSRSEQRHRLLEALNSYSIAQVGLGRLFARSQGLHPSDAAAILQIIAAEEREAPMTPARLAEGLSLTSGATSILLNRLEAAGHILRTRESRDRRVVTVRSTAAIHQSADGYYRPVGDRLAALVEDLTEGEIDLVERTVERLRQGLLEILDQPETQMHHRC